METRWKSLSTAGPDSFKMRQRLATKQRVAKALEAARLHADAIELRDGQKATAYTNGRAIARFDYSGLEPRLDVSGHTTAEITEQLFTTYQLLAEEMAEQKDMSWAHVTVRASDAHAMPEAFAEHPVARKDDRTITYRFDNNL